MRNFRKKSVALAYVDTAKLLIDDNYDCIDKIVDPRAILCDRYDAVLGEVSSRNMIKYRNAYVTLVGERTSLSGKVTIIWLQF